MKALPLLAQISSAQIIAGFAFSVLITLISYKIRAVNKSGAVGVVIVGTTIFGLGGPIFSIPLLFFYISSSIFSFFKTPGKIRSLEISEKTGARDFRQVMANGGVGTALTLVYFITGDVIWFFPYLAGLCEAAADTWSTELGTLYPDSPVSILTFKSVDPGQSGGVTILGTMAAGAGALTTMLAAATGGFLVKELLLFDMKIWLMTAACGLAGSLLDSALGASLQAQYRCGNCHRITERPIHCEKPTDLFRGIRCMNNDAVNLTCTAFSSFVAAITFHFAA
jgi:uncharacterized protein (TIGR00297 family)